MPETMNTAAAEHDLAELEASFLSFDGVPPAPGGLVLLAPAELSWSSPGVPDALDDPAMAASVRTRSTRCCYG
jgi:hypothetical protein